MIKTTRSRLEIRQEPDKTSSLIGAVFVAFGGVEALTALGQFATALWLDKPLGWQMAVIRLGCAALVGSAGWIFLQGRSRVVIDLGHRMVARYMGVGGRASGGNRTWDLAEFVAVVLVRRERRRFPYAFRDRSEVVCLRRPDGSDLELYWADDEADGDATAARAADFTGLPCLGRRAA